MAETPHALIGGFAVAFLGRARVTKDVDGIVAVMADELPAFLESGSRFGFEPRFADEVEFGRRHSVVRLRHLASGTEIDLSLALTSFEKQAISRSRVQVSNGVSFPLLQVEDLVVMKAFARRERDIADIEGLLDRNPDIDLKEVRRWLRLLGEADEDPTYLSEFDHLVGRWTSRKRLRDQFASDR